MFNGFEIKNETNLPWHFTIEIDLGEWFFYYIDIYREQSLLSCVHLIMDNPTINILFIIHPVQWVQSTHKMNSFVEVLG